MINDNLLTSFIIVLFTLLVNNLISKMAKPTGINTFICPGVNMGQLAAIYYQRTKPERGYSADQARNLFVRDHKLDFKVLRDCVNEIYSMQINLLNDGKSVGVEIIRISFIPACNKTDRG